MYPPTMFKSKVRKGISLKTSIKVGYKASLYYKGEKGHVIRKPSSGFPTSTYTNRVLQPRETNFGLEKRDCTI